MTYGVDQCRVCGVEISSGGPGPMERYLEERKHRRPTMTEAQWRAAGLKAAPTRHQLFKPTDGCCFKCRMQMGLSRSSPWKPIAGLVGCAIAIAAVIFWVGTQIN